MSWRLRYRDHRTTSRRAQDIRARPGKTANVCFLSSSGLSVVQPKPPFCDGHHSLQAKRVLECLHRRDEGGRGHADIRRFDCCARHVRRNRNSERAEREGGAYWTARSSIPGQLGRSVFERRPDHTCCARQASRTAAWMRATVQPAGESPIAGFRRTLLYLRARSGPRLRRESRLAWLVPGIRGR
jgi:hypothetical protein